MLNRITICSSNSTTGYLSKKMKTIIQKDICTPIFIAALFITAKMWKKPKCPLTNEWIKKMWSTHTHICTQWSTIQPLKKNEILPLQHGWLLEGIMLGEINQTEKHKCLMISLTYGIEKIKIKKQTIKLIQKENRWVVAKDGSGWNGWKESKGTNFQLFYFQLFILNKS